MYTAGRPQQRDGWISPSGEFYACPYNKHAECAEQFGCSVDSLERQGWAHISKGFIVNYPFRPTQPQLDMIFDIIQLDPGSGTGLALSVYIEVD